MSCDLRLCCVVTIKIFPYINLFRCYYMYYRQILHFIILYSKTSLKRPLKIAKTKGLMTNGSLMKVESVAECSSWSILQYFRPTLSNYRSWKPNFDKTKNLMTNGSLMKVESVAECSSWSILQYFWLTLSNYRSWKPNFDKTKNLMTHGSLMKVESVAEYTPWSILQYFGPALSNNRS